MKDIRFNGHFTFLDFNISHSKVLLRNNSSLKNTDIIFAGVIYFDLKLTLKNIYLKLALEDEQSIISTKIGQSLDGFKTYKIICEDGDFIVVAGNCQIFENKLEFSESSISDTTNEVKGDLILSI